MRHGFLFDLNRCTGCDACALACTIENDLPFGTSWRQVNTFNEARHPKAPVFHLSLACNHCTDAPCMESCPALAYRRDEVSGAVTIDAASCIGCGYCRWTCPFDAPRFDKAAGIMTKCTLCNHRLAESRDPACVAACPTTALGFGDIDADGTVGHVPGFPRDDVGPGIGFFPFRTEQEPLSTAGGPGPSPASGHRGERRHSPAIGLASEWPLAVFTLLAAGLVGWFAASSAGGIGLHPLAFLAVAAVAGAVSTMHLGRPLRAWRAMLNLRGSWLSREILFFSMFVAAGLSALVWGPEPDVLHGLTTILGVACLFSIDRVYDVARRHERPRIHSADALLTGAFVWAILSGSPTAIFAIAAIKLALYVARHLRRVSSARPWLAVLRLGVGFALPGLLWWFAPTGWPTGAFVAIAIGEVIDRCEFFVELDVPGPRGRIATDLEAWIS